MNGILERILHRRFEINYTQKKRKERNRREQFNKLCWRLKAVVQVLNHIFLATLINFAIILIIGSRTSVLFLINS